MIPNAMAGLAQYTKFFRDIAALPTRGCPAACHDLDQLLATLTWLVTRIANDVYTSAALRECNFPMPFYPAARLEYAGIWAVVWWWFGGTRGGPCFAVRFASGCVGGVLVHRVRRSWWVVAVRGLVCVPR